MTESHAWRAALSDARAVNESLLAEEYAEELDKLQKEHDDLSVQLDRYRNVLTSIRCHLASDADTRHLKYLDNLLRAAEVEMDD